MNIYTKIREQAFWCLFRRFTSRVLPASLVAFLLFCVLWGRKGKQLRLRLKETPDLTPVSIWRSAGEFISVGTFTLPTDASPRR